MIRRRREDAENPAWPGLVDIFGFTLAFLLLLWFAANWPEKVENLERKAQDLGATIASMQADNRQLREMNQSLSEKLRQQGLNHQVLAEKIQQLEASNKNLSDQTIKKHAEAVGLDMEKFDVASNNPALKKQIQEDLQLGSSVKVRGVPSIFINGRMPKQRSLAGFSQMIEEELKK